MALELLSEMGFPPPVTPRGLSDAVSQAESMRRGVIVGTEQEVRGAVAQVARDLEYIARVLLRFVSMAAYQRSPEQLLLEWSLIKPGERLGTIGLGRLLELVQELASHLTSDEGPGVAILKQELGGRSLAPGQDCIHRLAQARNKFVHYRSSEPGLTIEELRRRASGFLDDALDYFAHFSSTEGRVFPRVVRVDEIRIDRWGRRKVGVTDDQRETEWLFSDRELEPGRVYFMHPLTNVLRVDPILVAAGDLARFDSVGLGSDTGA